MKTKIISAIIAIVTFISCQEIDNDIIVINLPKTSKSWGYFKGTISDHNFQINNHRPSDKDSIYSIRQIIDNINNLHNDSINDISTGIMFPNKMRLNISIRNLNLGYKNISLTPIKEDNECYIIIYKDETTLYKPIKSNTFRVEIIKIDWETEFDPIMEVKINGYLFNENNTNDSIYINAIYGTR